MVLNLETPISGISFGDSNEPCIICKNRNTMGIGKNGKEVFALCSKHWEKVLHIYNFHFYNPIGIPYRNLTIELLKRINDLFSVLETDFHLLKGSKEYRLLKENVLGEDPLNWFGHIEQREFVFCPYCGKRLEKKE